jgi:glutathione S-transferase
VPYELIEVDLKNKPSELVQQNPYGKVPVLVDSDGVIYESAIINEYLQEKFPEPRLMPRDLLERSKVRIWVDFFNSRVHPSASDLQKNRDEAKRRLAAAVRPIARTERVGDVPQVLAERLDALADSKS